MSWLVVMIVRRKNDGHRRVLVLVELFTIDVHNLRYTRHSHELQRTSPRVELTFKTLVLTS